MTAVLRAITGQIDYHWTAGIWPRISDLTDAEYLWEPVPSCWTLRGTGDGLVMYDFEWPPPEPAPFTTIAWRLCHIAVGCFAERGTRYFPEHMSRPWTKPLWDGPFGFPLHAAGGPSIPRRGVARLAFRPRGRRRGESVAAVGRSGGRHR